MSKNVLIVLAVLGFAILPSISSASDRQDDINRTHKAAEVFKEIMNTPDKGIPRDLLDSAKCIAIIPGDVKFAFIFGGNYGRGLATCRTDHGWSSPIFIAGRWRQGGIPDRRLFHRPGDALHERPRLAKSAQ